MILFKPEHVQPILDGRKTQTRRMGAKRWNVGAVHQARTRMLDTSSTFARLRIVDVRWEQLVSIDAAGARAEGYETPVAYLAAFQRINHVSWLNGSEYVWVIDFELVGLSQRREG